MDNIIFYNQIQKFNPINIVEIKNAMKEVLQDIILSGFGKSDFFNYCAFYGGTSLRIFRKLPRFSEDLDFTLIKNVENFNFDKYLSYVKNELDSLGLEFVIDSKEKNITTSVISRYFKFNLKKLFEMSYPSYIDKIINNEILSIKVEVETQIFAGAKYETKLLTYPSFSQIRTFDMETLFASKLLAVLNRKWKNRIKGRDFYDYLFYISNNSKVNISFLENGLKKFGYLNIDEELTLDRLKQELTNRFNEIDFENAKQDVLNFVKNDDKIIEGFKKEIFISSVDLIEATNY